MVWYVGLPGDLGVPRLALALVLVQVVTSLGGSGPPPGRISLLHVRPAKKKERRPESVIVLVQVLRPMGGPLLLLLLRGERVAYGAFLFWRRAWSLRLYWWTAA